MRKRKKTIKKTCESVYYNFLNNYKFEEKIKEEFEKYFELFLQIDTPKKHQFWISHRNFFFILAYKNGYTLPYIADFFGKKHCSVIHNIRLLTERLEMKDSFSIQAKENVNKFLKSYYKEEKKQIVKEEQIKETTMDLVDSVEALDFFNNFEFDLDKFILFKFKLGVKFISRKEPDIFYRNFLIIALYKKYEKLNFVGCLFDIDHATVINAIKKTCDLVNNNDKQIIEIFEKIKIFFNSYCERKVNQLAIRQAI